jgi:hypothetical protein
MFPLAGRSPGSLAIIEQTDSKEDQLQQMGLAA